MSDDLIFLLVSRRKWKEWQNDGMFKPSTDINQDGYVRCLTGRHVQDQANERFSGRKQILLLVIHTTRLHSEVEWEEVDGERLPFVKDGINLDAIIDKIPVHADESGQYQIDIQSG
jgi:uncharacterized protein (DUF952 family)